MEQSVYYLRVAAKGGALVMFVFVCGAKMI